MADTSAFATGPAPLSGRDRRRYPRVRGPFEGEWAGAAGTGAARIWDLSVGGCYIDSLNDQRAGEHVDVDITMPEGRIHAGGEIVYSTPNQGFAVHFTEVSDGDREVLQRVVDRLIDEGRAI
jgi:hypothetical protein